MSTSSGPRAPYGPATAHVRFFLVRLAGLGKADRDDVVQRYAAQCLRAEYLAAETLLGETLERSGRTDARDALAGPLMQLVRQPDSANEASDAGAPDDDLASLHPIAEPALAALLALLVADLLPADVTALLYAPFAERIPRPA